MLKNRISIKFCGESGQGINSIGKIFSKSLNEIGYRIFAYREYPSLIQGGYASYQIDFSNEEIQSSSRYADILAIIDIDSYKEYWNTIAENGLLIYTDESISITKEQEDFFKRKNVKHIYIDVKKITTENNGTSIMNNIVILAFIWKCLKLPLETIEHIVSDVFKNKDIDLETELKCLRAGYKSTDISYPNIPGLEDNVHKELIITGNDSIALGAIAGGVRAYYAYPMTPATSIFKLIGSTYKDTKILVKQAENEITAAQMALGSMYMGTRALTATSGGGFDLMTETISCAGISETPLVIILAQRTGAGTGLPTWTGSGDVNVAIKGGHGEFPRCVISVSDAQSAYIGIQEALNIADKYQLPVIVLTEKQIAESIYNIKEIPQPIPIERNLSNEGPRYKITENGISPRWIPSENLPPYLNTSDEHDENSTSTERSSTALTMTEKRFRKLNTLLKELPEPQLYGDEKAKNIFVGYGSTKGTMLDAIEQNNQIAYLHYEYLFPLRTETLDKLIKEGRNLTMVENNKMSEFSRIITEHTRYRFNTKLLKYDGRPFFVEDILDYTNTYGN